MTKIVARARRIARFVFSRDGFMVLIIAAYLLWMMSGIVDCVHDFCDAEAALAARHRAGLHRDPVSPSFSPELGR